MGEYYIFTKYNYPLPNNGKRYDLSEEELVKLLDNAYEHGWDHAREVYDPSLQPTLTVASSVEDIDDNTRWKEVWIK